MAEKRKNKDTKQHFHIFSTYLGLSFAECEKEMLEYFWTKLDGTIGKSEIKSKKREKKRQIRNWWSGIQSPHPNKTIPFLNQFFLELADLNKLDWDDTWINKTLDQLSEEDALEYAYNRVVEPFAVARYFRQYYGEKKEYLDSFIREYCQNRSNKNNVIEYPKYYLLYRLHTLDRSLVCDLIKIVESDAETMFCTLYQYTEQEVIDPYYSKRFPKKKNCKRFAGNVYYNNYSVNMIFVSVANKGENSPQYLHLVFKRFDRNKSEKGLVVDLSDEGNFPVAMQVFIKKHEIPMPFDMNDFNKYVRKIPKNSEEYTRNKEEYDAIYTELENKVLEVK